jgi:hypothetical protein
MCDIDKEGYGSPPSKRGRSKLDIGRGRFVIAHVGGIVLTTALIVGMTATASFAIRLLLAGE